MCALAALLVALIAFNFVYRLAHERDTQRVISDIESLRPLLEKRFELMRHDLEVLSTTPPMQGIVRSIEHGGIDPLDGSSLEAWKARLAVVFGSVLKVRGVYNQMRYIGLDDQGRELVRVDRQGDVIATVVPENLQRKGAETYFQQAMQLRVGQIHFSSLTRNREWGKVVPGNRPVVRASTPVFDGAGQPFGLLVINVDFTELVSEILGETRSPWDLTLADQAGNFIRFDADTGDTRFYWADSDPAAQATVDAMLASARGEPLVTSDNGISTTSFIIPVNLGEASGLGVMRLAASAPHDKLFAEADSLATLMLVLLIAVVAIAAAVGALYGRRFVHPIRELTGAVVEYQSTGALERLPVDAPGEIGQLAQSFHNFVQSLEVAWDAEQLSHLKLINIVDNSVDGILTLDPQGRIQSFNPACTIMFGYQPEEVIGEEFSRLLADKLETDDMDQAASPEDWFWSATGGIQEVVAKLKDGRQIPVELSLSRVDLSGVELFSAVIRDISERTAANELVNDTIARVTEINEQLTHTNERLDQSNRDIRALTHIVSHDLRAPLINILAFTGELQTVVDELLESLPTQAAGEATRWQSISEDELPTVLGFITSSAQKMDDRLNFILKLSRLGTYEFEPKTIDLNLMVADLIAQLIVPEERDSVTVEIDVPAFPIDYEAMSIIVSNLLSNAAKYRAAERPLAIHITAHINDGMLTFMVQDNGRGIADENLADVFTLFRRIGKQDTQGEGIGLAYCQTLITRLQGSISCKSKEGVGSMFIVQIPVERLEAERGAA